MTSHIRNDKRKEKVKTIWLIMVFEILPILC